MGKQLLTNLNFVGRPSTNQDRRRQESLPLKRGGSDPLALRGGVRKLSSMADGNGDGVGSSGQHRGVERDEMKREALNR